MRSASWRLTRPVRAGMRVLRHGLGPQERQQLTLALRQRYHRLPLPTPARRPARHAWHDMLAGKARPGAKLSARRLFEAPALGDRHRPQPACPITWSGAFSTGIFATSVRNNWPAARGAGRQGLYVSATLIDDAGRFRGRVAGRFAPPVPGAPVPASPGPDLPAGPSRDALDQLRRSLGEWLAWADALRIVSLVQHPYWTDVASVVPNSTLVYDCMDHHQGFGHQEDGLTATEQRLLALADLTIVTSGWLEKAVAGLARRWVTIRNAGDFEHFSRPPDDLYIDPQGRPIIGYYGAIADWFDVDLVREVAIAHPRCLVLLVGADTVDARGRLADVPTSS
ncbi:MAG: hypothetical protein R3E68_20420 [Burkholderiaceae bacterium]